MSAPVGDGVGVFNGIVFNETILNQYHLVFYERNGTLSNSSVCYYLTNQAPSDSPPTLFTNGSIIPTPSLCSDPVLPIRLHGILGIFIGCLFVLMMLLALDNVRKLGFGNMKFYHNQQFATLRYGARRQHYLIILTSALGAVTTFIGVDVDREVVPGLSFKVQCIFFSLLNPFTLLSLFEAVRYHDWTLTKNHEILDHRSMETQLATCLAIVFYLLDGAALLVLIARDWNDFTQQFYAEQAMRIARVSGTGPRFRVGNILMLACVAAILARLSISWIQCRRWSPNLATVDDRRQITALALATILSTLPVIYCLISAFVWSISPYNVLVSQAWYYNAGINFIVLALAILNIIGYLGNANGRTVGDDAGRSPLKRNKPKWWRSARVATKDDGNNHFEMKAIGDVRGREEKFSNESIFSWWQKDDDGKQPAEDGMKSRLLENDIVGQWQSRTHHSDVGISDVQTANGSSAAQKGSRYRSQQRQGYPVRSMLDI